MHVKTKTSQRKREGSKEGFSESPAEQWEPHLEGPKRQIHKCQGARYLMRRSCGYPCSHSFLTCSPGFFLTCLFSLLSSASSTLSSSCLLFSPYSPLCFLIFLLSLKGPIQQLLFFFSLELCCFLSVKKKKKVHSWFQLSCRRLLITIITLVLPPA